MASCLRQRACASEAYPKTRRSGQLLLPVAFDVRVGVVEAVAP